MSDGTVGAFVISWAQTAIDDVAGAPAGDLRAGASWRWVGQALRVDGPSGTACLGRAIGWADLHERAARSARRLCTPVTPFAPLPPAQARQAKESGTRQDPLLDRGFVLTDGIEAWTASRIETGPGRPALVLFHGSPPPQERELWVVRVFSNRRADARAGRSPTEPVAGLAAGCLVATPDGQRPVETLRPGDAVLTRDAGPCRVLWRGLRRLTVADLGRAPDDRPLRLAAAAFGATWRGPDLRVGPDEHLVVGGPVVRALFGAAEVMVRAGDLRDHPGVAPDLAVPEMTLVRILLERQQILTAHGFGCASFHPDMPALRDEALRESGLLRRLGPDIPGDPDGCGPPVRRCLSGAEAAVLVSGGDLRAVA